MEWGQDRVCVFFVFVLNSEKALASMMRVIHRFVHWIFIFKVFFKHSYYSCCGLKMVYGPPYTVIERLFWFVIWGWLYHTLDIACFSFPIYQSWKQWLTALEMTVGLALLLTPWELLNGIKACGHGEQASSEQHSKSAVSYFMAY